MVLQTLGRQWGNCKLKLHWLSKEEVLNVKEVMENVEDEVASKVGNTGRKNVL